WSWPGSKRSMPSARRPRFARACSAALPMMPSPTTTTSKFAITPAYLPATDCNTEPQSCAERDHVSKVDRAMRGFGVIAVLMLIGTSAMAVERPALRRTLPAFERGQLVPLPRPRPPEAPTAPVRAAEPETAPTPEEQGPSDCFLRVTESLVQATPLPAIAGPGECGAADVLTLEAIMLPDKRRVALQPPATMRCSMAEAMANWVRDDVARVLKGLGSPLAGIENYTSYECRSRNGIPGAKLSEHGRANALDIRAFVLGDRRQFVLTDYEADEDLRKELRASACGRFTTVLGPGSDGYHESHIHVDLAERHSGYRICQWNVLTEPPIPLPR